MLNSFATVLAKVLIAPLIYVAGLAGYSIITTHDLAVIKSPALSQNLGQFNISGGGTYRLKSSLSSSATSLTLSSFKEPVSLIPYTMAYLNSDIGYATIDPQTSSSEFVSFTGITQNSDGSATVSGLTRGLARSFPFTASSTLRQPHSGQSIFILSDSPQLFNEFANKRATSTIAAVWTFGSTTRPKLDVDVVSTVPSELVTVGQLNSTAFNGAPTSSETAIGLAELATRTEQANSTASSSLGGPLVLQAKHAANKYDAASSSQVVVTNSSNFIDSNFISTSSNYIWGGATTTFSGVISSTNIASSTWGQLGIARGSANTYTIQLDPYQSSYGLGLSLLFNPSATNTLASTLNVNNLGAKNIKGKWGNDPLPGDIRTGTLARVTYDGTNFQLQNPQQARIEPASTTAAWVISEGTCPNTSWQTVYLGYIVGTTTSMVNVHAWPGVSGGGPNTSYITFRANGDTASTTGGLSYIGNNNMPTGITTVDGYAMVPTDNQGAIQWRCGIVGGSNSYNLVVHSYWNF